MISNPCIDLFFIVCFMPKCLFFLPSGTRIISSLSIYRSIDQYHSEEYQIIDLLCYETPPTILEHILLEFFPNHSLAFRYVINENVNGCLSLVLKYFKTRMSFPALLHICQNSVKLYKFPMNSFYPCVTH